MNPQMPAVKLEPCMVHVGLDGRGPFHLSFSHKPPPSQTDKAPKSHERTGGSGARKSSPPSTPQDMRPLPNQSSS